MLEFFVVGNVIVFDVYYSGILTPKAENIVVFCQILPPHKLERMHLISLLCKVFGRTGDAEVR